MGRKKKKNIPQLPDSVTSQLSEHSIGWMVFYFDIEGNMNIASSLSDAPQFKAMRSDIKNWILAMDEIEKNITLQSILGANGE